MEYLATGLPPPDVRLGLGPDPMRITKLKIRNYKSFYESPDLEFTSGFNIIAGQNNTGKTALLEALGLNFGPNPHRTLKTVPTRNTIVDPESSVDVSAT